MPYKSQQNSKELNQLAEQREARRKERSVKRDKTAAGLRTLLEALLVLSQSLYVLLRQGYAVFIVNYFYEDLYDTLLLVNFPCLGYITYLYSILLGDFLF